MALTRSGVTIPDLQSLGFDVPQDANIYDRSLQSRMSIPDDANPYDLQTIMGQVLRAMYAQPQQQQVMPPAAPAPGINTVANFNQAPPPPTGGAAMPFTGQPLIGATPNAMYTGGAQQTPPGGVATNTYASQQAPPSTTVQAQGIQVRMPGGGTQVFPDDSPFLQQALSQGGQAINPTTGQPMKVTPFPGGGFLFDGQPFNYWTSGGQYLPGQQQALARGFYTPGTTPGANTGTNAGGVQPGGLTPGAPGNLGGGTSQLPGFVDPTGQYSMSGASQVNPITLPGTPDINPYFMDPAQLDLNQIPYTQNSDQLNFLLSGQGYAPDVLARMNANAIDANARATMANRASAKIGAEQSGFVNSPALQAIQAQQSRLGGEARQTALNNISINNAQTGMENIRQGVPLAQQLALENAARLFSGMTTNVQNAQSANQTNAGYGNQANYANAQNQINQGLNQAQLNRQGDIYNANVQENRFGQSFNAYQNLINGQNAAPTYNIGATNANTYTPNLGYANLLQNMAVNNGVRTT